MKTRTMRLGLYRGLYWANQGLLHAVRALEEATTERPEDATFPSLPASELLNDKLRRTQAMIEETRAIMNRMLLEWIERKE